MPTQPTTVDGIAAVEKAILDEASVRQLPSLRLEWNEDQDFAHLMDPVPVVIMTPDGKSVEQSFSAQELRDCADGKQTSVHAKIRRMLDELQSQKGGAMHGESRGF